MSTTPPAVTFNQDGWTILGHAPLTRFRAARDLLMNEYAMDLSSACAHVDQAHLTYLNTIAHPDITIAAEQGAGFLYHCQDGHCTTSRGHDSPGGASYNAMLHLSGPWHR